MTLGVTQIPVSHSHDDHVVVHGHDTRLDLAAAPPPEGPPFDYRVTGVVTSQLDVGFAASLDFPATFTSKIDASMMFYLLDLLALLPMSPDESGQFEGVVWGLGIRVGIVTAKFESHMAASVAGVAANATLNSSYSAYQVKSVGLGVEVIEMASDFFRIGSGSFDAASVQSLGAGLQSISTHLIEEAKSRPPSPVYVVSETPKADLAKVEAISAAFALNSIMQGASYNAAISGVSRNHPIEVLVNESQVAAVYRSIVNDAGNDVPSDPQRQRAAELYALKGNY